MSEPTGRNGPALWDTILEIVGPYWQPCVAGGAVRDFFLKQEPKDIDVFVPASSIEDFTSIISVLSPNLCNGRIISLSDTDCASAYEAGEENEVYGVWEGEIMDLPVNIVGRKSLGQSKRALIETFDFGINQCVRKQGGFFITTLAFEDDLINKTFTLAHNRTYEQSLARFDRINARHGGVYRLVDPFITEL